MVDAAFGGNPTSDDFIIPKATAMPHAGLRAGSTRQTRLDTNLPEALAYQQSDYIGWIEQAQRQEIKVKRLRQVFVELEEDGMAWAIAREEK